MEAIIIHASETGMDWMRDNWSRAEIAKYSAVPGVYWNTGDFTYVDSECMPVFKHSCSAPHSFVTEVPNHEDKWTYMDNIYNMDFIE